MARCPACGDIIPVGPNCLTEDTDCWAWTGAGTEASPKVVSPRLDAALTNLLTCSDDGLMGELPAVISNPPAVQAFRSTNLSVANNTATAVNLNQERYDTDGMHSIAANTSRLTVVTAGTYTFTFVCMWDKNVTGNRVAYIRKNGTDILAYESKKAGGADLYVGHSVVVQDDFIATDYVEGVVLQTSGVALRLLAESNSPILSGSYV